MQTGEQPSRGLEFDGIWQVPIGLSLLATYTLTAAEVTRDTVILIGNTLANVPRHAGRAWGKYALPQVRGGTVAIAFGATYLGEQQANIANTFTVPGSLVADAGIFWELGSVGVQLNIVNLFDKHYALRSAFGNTGIIPGEARRVVFTVKTSLREGTR